MPSTVPTSLTGTDSLEAHESRTRVQDGSIVFGPRWTVIQTMRLGDRVVEGDLTLADRFLSDLGDHPLHPALLDVAATLGLSLLDEEARSGLVYAPMSATRIRLFRRLPAAVTVRAALIADDDRRMSTFDVVIKATDGEVLMIIDGLAMRAVDPETLTHKDQITTSESSVAGDRHSRSGCSRPVRSSLRPDGSADHSHTGASGPREAGHAGFPLRWPQGRRRRLSLGPPLPLRSPLDWPRSGRSFWVCRPSSKLTISST